MNNFIYDLQEKIPAFLKKHKKKLIIGGAGTLAVIGIVAFILISGIFLTPNQKVGVAFLNTIKGTPYESIIKEFEALDFSDGISYYTETGANELVTKMLISSNKDKTELQYILDESVLTAGLSEEEFYICGEGVLIRWNYHDKNYPVWLQTDKSKENYRVIADALKYANSGIKNIWSGEDLVSEEIIKDENVIKLLKVYEEVSKNVDDFISSAEFVKGDGPIEENTEENTAGESEITTDVLNWDTEVSTEGAEKTSESNQKITDANKQYVRYDLHITNEDICKILKPAIIMNAESEMGKQAMIEEFKKNMPLGFVLSCYLEGNKIHHVTLYVKIDGKITGDVSIYFIGEEYPLQDVYVQADGKTILHIKSEYVDTYEVCGTQTTIYNESGEEIYQFVYNEDTYKFTEIKETENIFAGYEVKEKNEITFSFEEGGIVIDKVNIKRGKTSNYYLRIDEKIKIAGSKEMMEPLSAGTEINLNTLTAEEAANINLVQIFESFTLPEINMDNLIPGDSDITEDEGIYEDSENSENTENSKNSESLN